MHFQDGEAHPFDPRRRTPGPPQRLVAGRGRAAVVLAARRSAQRATAAWGSKWNPCSAARPRAMWRGATSAVFVTFRGTEPGEPGDTLDDLTFALAPWDKDAGTRASWLQGRARPGVGCPVGPARRAGSQAVGLVRRAQPGRRAGGTGGRPIPGDSRRVTLGSPRVGDWHFAASLLDAFRRASAALRERRRRRHPPAAADALQACRRGAFHRPPRPRFG